MPDSLLKASAHRTQKLWTIRVAALAACAIVIACGADKGGKAAGANAATQLTPAFKPLAVGDSAPLYNTVTLNGDSVHVGRKGEPVTVMNIWATWCTSCREEMSDLQALQEEFAPKGVRILAVSVDATDPSRVREFAKQEKLTFSVAHDPDGNVQQLYQVVGIPGTYVVDRNGRLLWKSIGNMHGVVDSLRAVLSKAQL